MNKSFKLYKVLIAVVTVVVLGLIMLFGGVYTIDQGDRGVILRFGKITSISDAGLHFKIPFITDVKRISVRTFTTKLKKVWSYSFDQQPADISMSVTYSVKPDGAGDLYSQFGTVDNAFDRVIIPVVMKDVKVIFGGYTAVKAVQDRNELNQKIFNLIKESLKPYPFLVVHSVQVENIDFSDAYEKTIEDRMKAEVEVAKFQQNLNREKIQAEIAVTKAKGLADSQIEQAKAQAQAILMKNKAEADGIRLKGEALAAYPNVVNVMQIDKWDGKLPTTMLPNTALPIIK